MIRNLILIIILSLCLSSAVFGAELVTDGLHPVQGEGTVVVLKGHEAPYNVSLTAIYRPNSATAVEKKLGKFDPDGKLIWKPESAGITTLVAKSADDKKVASKNVGTSYPSAPISGIAVMLFAGILLFGGAGYSLRNALKQ